MDERTPLKDQITALTLVDKAFDEVYEQSRTVYSSNDIGYFREHIRSLLYGCAHNLVSMDYLDPSYLANLQIEIEPKLERVIQMGAFGRAHMYVTMSCDKIPLTSAMNFFQRAILCTLHPYLYPGLVLEFVDIPRIPEPVKKSWLDRLRS
jgi:hypothetical protein